MFHQNYIWEHNIFSMLQRAQFCRKEPSVGDAVSLAGGTRTWVHRINRIRSLALYPSATAVVTINEVNTIYLTWFIHQITILLRHLIYLIDKTDKQVAITLSILGVKQHVLFCDIGTCINEIAFLYPYTEHACIYKS